MTITINDYDYIDYNEPRLLLEWLLYQLELGKINKTGNITKFEPTWHGGEGEGEGGKNHF